MNLGRKYDEKLMVISTLLILGFVYLTVSADVGNILSILVAIYGFIVIFERYPFQFVRKIELSSFIIIGLSFFAWALISFGLTKLFYPNAIVNGFSGLAKFIMAHTNFPILSGSKLVTTLVWGVVFPLVETMGLLCGTMYLWSKVLRVRLNQGFVNRSYKMWLLVLLVGASCSLYHLMVRQANDFALFSDMVFFTISAILSLKRNQLFEAFGLHTLINILVMIFGG